jgi:hypothetical protein
MAVDQNWARSVGLTPVSDGMPPPAPLNFALPTMLASVLQQGGIRAPSSGGIPASAVVATPPRTQSLAPYASSSVIAGYADGGAVGPNGMPVLGAPQIPGGMAPPAAPAAPEKQLDPQQVQAELKKFIAQRPDQVRQIQEVIQQALTSGELSMQELNLAIQLAVAAAQNPAMYPKLRQLAIQKGLGGEEDIPQQYDQSMVFSLILAGQAMQAGGAGVQQGMEPTNPQGPAQRLKDGGGVLPRNNNPRDDKAEGRRDDIKIAVSGGEYVIPAHIVAQKGTDFFDKMIGKDIK